MSAFRPYRPSNGTEGDYFEAEFCDRCSKDDGVSPFNEPGTCIIRCNAFVFGIDEPEYPRDTWVYFNGRPTCLAFVERGGRDDPDNALQPTDPAQLDLFESIPELIEA